ncbi:flagellar assembly protein FliW [Clostridium fallax]|uniref:Flagellar assembly factor FliW n=1 Tax=Clostridium fallax TaxID=1533 RepID=A0A1M4UM35_9CLOT|nr:flagellar assembly protein FliW [Clostridium fallax]SHE57725.1 flagellar assembly factor FliW [Clostridium fallax]SQB07637.1 flagellar assembly factor FliW [Clostridium fallax]
MEINTKYHGILKYNDENIIEFKKGILGFKDLKKFILLDLDNNPSFKLLHSIEDDEVGFIVISSFDFFKEYEFNLKKDTIENLKVKSSEEILILSTITLNSDVEKITTNLRAPIIINIISKLGEQIILDKEEYKVKHPLYRGDK